MTQEQIRKHIDEMRRWADAPDGTKVWSKYSKNDSWIINNDPPFWPICDYVVDDEWAELRKAEIDGHHLQLKTQDGRWVWRELYSMYMETTTPDRWRIAPKAAFPKYRRRNGHNIIFRFDGKNHGKVVMSNHISEIGKSFKGPKAVHYDDSEMEEVPTVEISGQIFYDTQPVWVWFDDYIASRAVRFVYAKNNGLFKENGMRGGLGQHNIAPVENIESWMVWAWQRLQQ